MYSFLNGELNEDELTAREIIHYMCRETLISYLVEKSAISEDAVKNFILYRNYFKDEEIFSPDKNINRLAELDKFLKDVKVADLAVGSGSFPLGMLNEISKAREVLTTYLNLSNPERFTRRLYDLRIEILNLPRLKSRGSRD